MDDPFTVGPGKTPGPLAVAADEIVRGDSWSIKLRGGDYVLDYMSGELADRTRYLTITRAETAAIAGGELNVDAVIIANRA